MDIYLICWTIIIALILYIAWHELLYEPNKLTVVSKTTNFSEYLRNNCTLLGQGFKPAIGTGNKHIQTFLPALLPKPSCRLDRQYLQLPDGGKVSLDWGECLNLVKSAPIVILLPGLTGDSNGLRPICAMCVAEGIRPVIFHKRGHGGTSLSSPWMQSFGDPHDLQLAVADIRRQFPDAPLMSVGYSAGSGLLGMYGMHRAAEAEFLVGIGVSPAYDSELLFKNNPSPLYHFIMLRSLKNLVLGHKDMLQEVVDYNKVMESKTIAEFDEHFYSKLYGFQNSDEYYRHNNPLQCMGNVHFPAVLINSMDDPLCGPDRIPFERFRRDPSFILVGTERGGHCGFVESWRGTMWSDRLAVDIMKTALSFNKITTYHLTPAKQQAGTSCEVSEANKRKGLEMSAVIQSS